MSKNRDFNADKFLETAIKILKDNEFDFDSEKLRSLSPKESKLIGKCLDNTLLKVDTNKFFEGGTVIFLSVYAKHSNGKWYPFTLRLSAENVMTIGNRIMPLEPKEIEILNSNNKNKDFQYSAREHTMAAKWNFKKWTERPEVDGDNNVVSYPDNSKRTLIYKCAEIIDWWFVYKIASLRKSVLVTDEEVTNEDELKPFPEGHNKQITCESVKVFKVARTQFKDKKTNKMKDLLIPTVSIKIPFDRKTGKLALKQCTLKDVEKPTECVGYGGRRYNGYKELLVNTSLKDEKQVKITNYNIHTISAGSKIFGTIDCRSIALSQMGISFPLRFKYGVVEKFVSSKYDDEEFALGNISDDDDDQSATKTVSSSKDTPETTTTNTEPTANTSVDEALEGFN